MSTQKFATNTILAGQKVAANGGARTVPKNQITFHVFDDSDGRANLFNLFQPRYINTRWNNSSKNILLQRILDLKATLVKVAKDVKRTGINANPI